MSSFTNLANSVARSSQADTHYWATLHSFSVTTKEKSLEAKHYLWSWSPRAKAYRSPTAFIFYSSEEISYVPNLHPGTSSVLQLCKWYAMLWNQNGLSWQGPLRSSSFSPPCYMCKVANHQTRLQHKFVNQNSPRWYFLEFCSLF